MPWKAIRPVSNWVIIDKNVLGNFLWYSLILLRLVKISTASDLAQILQSTLALISLPSWENFLLFRTSHIFIFKPLPTYFEDFPGHVPPKYFLNLDGSFYSPFLILNPAITKILIKYILITTINRQYLPVPTLPKVARIAILSDRVAVGKVYFAVCFAF